MKIVRIVILSGIAVILSVSGAFCADEMITAAVLDLDAKEGVSAGVVSTVTDYLRTQLVKTNKFNIVTRENMESILKEQQFQLSGCTSQECIVQMGQLLGVRNMFTGSIGKVGSTYIINLKLINVQSGKIDKADAEEAYSEDQLLLATRNLASKMAGIQTIPIASPQAAAAPAYSYAEQPAAAAPYYSLPQPKLEKTGVGAQWNMMALFSGGFIPAFSMKMYYSGEGSTDGRFDLRYIPLWGSMHEFDINIVPTSWHFIPDLTSPVQPYIDLGIDMWVAFGNMSPWINDYFEIGEGLHVAGGVEFFAGPVGFYAEGGVGVVLIDFIIYEDYWGDSVEDFQFFNRVYFPLNFGVRAYF